MVAFCLAGGTCASKLEDVYFPFLVGVLPAMDRERKRGAAAGVFLDLRGFTRDQHRR